MKSRKFSRGASLIAMFVCCLSAAAAAQEASKTPEGAPKTLEEALQALSTNMTEVKSWSADLSMGLTMKGASLSYTGTTKMLGDLSASDLNVTMQGRTLKSRVVMDPDGIQWSETNMNGNVQVTKIDMVQIMAMTGGQSENPLGLGPGAPVDVTKKGADMIRSYQKSFDVAFTGEAELGGTKVYQFEGYSKTGLDGRGELAALGLTAHKIRLAIGLEDGILRTMQMLDRQGIDFLHLQYSNLALNPEFPPETFRYAPPANATVKDMTEAISLAIKAQNIAGGTN